LRDSKNQSFKKGQGFGKGLGAGLAFYLGLTKVEATCVSAAAAINVGLGIRSERGTAGYALESGMINASKGNTGFAELDAIEAALLMTGGVASDALVAWDTFDEAIQAAGEALNRLQF
jgi:hypothetical protein